MTREDAPLPTAFRLEMKGESVHHHFVLLHALAILLTAPAWSQAGWPFSSDDGPPRGTPEWYEMRAADPVGAPQKYHWGKFWPPRPRPTGPGQTFIHKYHTAHYWPYPYIFEDRAAVESAFQMQAERGWEACSTLYDYHFDPSTHQINAAGRKHLRWILATAPEGLRQTYVAMAEDPAYNGVRLQTAQQAAELLVGVGNAPPLELRYAAPAGRPSNEVQAIHEGRLKNMPQPVIQYTPVSGGGSSGP